MCGIRRFNFNRLQCRRRQPTTTLSTQPIGKAGINIGAGLANARQTAQGLYLREYQLPQPPQYSGRQVSPPTHRHCHYWYTTQYADPATRHSDVHIAAPHRPTSPRANHYPQTSRALNSPRSQHHLTGTNHPMALAQHRRGTLL